MGAVQGEDFVALAGKHAANLMITAFGQDEVGCSWIYNTKFGGQARIFFVGEQQGAAGEKRDEAGGEFAGERGAVGFGDFVFRRSQAMHQLGLVGEEEEAGGFFVEAADAGDLGVALTPAWRDQAVDVGPFAFVVRADEAEGLVQHEQQAAGVIQWFAVDLYVGCQDLLRRIFCGDSAYLHVPGLEPVAGFATRAVTEVGEELIEAAWRHGAIGRGVGRGGKKEPCISVFGTSAFVKSCANDYGSLKQRA